MSSGLAIAVFILEPPEKSVCLVISAQYMDPLSLLRENTRISAETCFPFLFSCDLGL